MKSADLRNRNDAPDREVVGESAAQVPFAKDEDMILPTASC